MESQIATAGVTFESLNIRLGPSHSWTNDTYSMVFDAPKLLVLTKIWNTIPVENSIIKHRILLSLLTLKTPFTEEISQNVKLLLFAAIFDSSVDKKAILFTAYYILRLLPDFVPTIDTFNLYIAQNSDENVTKWNALNDEERQSVLDNALLNAKTAYDERMRDTLKKTIDGISSEIELAISNLYHTGLVYNRVVTAPDQRAILSVSAHDKTIHHHIPQLDLSQLPFETRFFPPTRYIEEIYANTPIIPNITHQNQPIKTVIDPLNRNLLPKKDLISKFANKFASLNKSANDLISYINASSTCEQVIGDSSCPNQSELLQDSRIKQNIANQSFACLHDFLHQTKPVAAYVSPQPVDENTPEPSSAPIDVGVKRTRDEMVNETRRSSSLSTISVPGTSAPSTPSPGSTSSHESLPPSKRVALPSHQNDSSSDLNKDSKSETDYDLARMKRLLDSATIPISENDRRIALDFAQGKKSREYNPSGIDSKKEFFVFLGNYDDGTRLMKRYLCFDYLKETYITKLFKNFQTN